MHLLLLYLLLLTTTTTVVEVKVFRRVCARKRRTSTFGITTVEEKILEALFACKSDGTAQ